MNLTGERLQTAGSYQIETRQAVACIANFVGIETIRTTNAQKPVCLDGSKFLTSKHHPFQSNFEFHSSDPR
jgi:hypothetical protein